jgi:hypothetical protein
MMRAFRSAAPLVILVLTSPAPSLARADAPAEKRADFDPTERYAVRQIEGWTVLVNKGFLGENAGLCDRVLEQLRHQLYTIRHRLPAPAVEKLSKVKIWVELKEPHHSCMVYHPDAAWLRKKGMNPDKARCVELANAENFLAWSVPQPCMVLHELAHAYHDQFLADGYENAEVAAVYRKAVESKVYESVLHISGRKQRAYAIKNPMEYFAESTEAYFGTNDFFPFVRAELKEHDPAMFALMKKIWEQAGAAK